MRRFYCSVCKRLKRVRVMPDSVDRPYLLNPQDRVGECRWHRVKGHVTHRESNSRTRKRPVIITRKSAPAPTPKASKKTRRAGE